jgi:hypothetical protein
MMRLRHSSNDSPRNLRWLIGASIGFCASAWLPLSTLWQQVYAQNFTEQEISNYAAAVLDIEKIRVQAHAEISDFMTGKGLDSTDYDLRCLTTDSLDLPRVVRAPVRILLINFCNDAKKSVEDNGLTAQKFNTITVHPRNNESLTEQIQLEIARQR